MWMESERETNEKGPEMKNKYVLYFRTGFVVAGH